MSFRAVLRRVGSLWFAAVLLLLLLVAMAVATVHETTHGSEQTLAVFYRAWWFQGLWALLALNIVAAVAVRYPFRRRQIGFVLAHAGVLITLAAALVTQRCGVDGRVAIVEGTTARDFRIDLPTLTLARGANTADLDLARLDPASRAEHPLGVRPALTLGGVAVSLLRYLPDARHKARVRDDSPRPRVGVELALGEFAPTWVLDGETARLGPLALRLRAVGSHGELDRQLALVAAPSSQPSQGPLIVADLGGTAVRVPLADALARAVALGDGGYSLRVLRYLPHAVVGAKNQLVNASERPENPAIEAELIGPQGSERRIVFAKFPDFSSMHGRGHAASVKLTLQTPTAGADSGAELLVGPQQAMHLVLTGSDGKRAAHAVTLGQRVPTPWHGRALTVLRRFERAQLHRELAAVEPRRETPTPGLLLEVRRGRDVRRVALLKGEGQALAFAGDGWSVRFGDRIVPLGFEVQLRSFKLRRYPGSNRPRSFESHVTLIDPARGLREDRMVSMNNPLSHGGYSLHQSSYELGERNMTVLSVSRDPGRVVAFVGYVATMLGMLIVLLLRGAAQRQVATAADDVPDEQPSTDGSTRRRERRPAVARHGEV